MEFSFSEQQKMFKAIGARFCRVGDRTAHRARWRPDETDSSRADSRRCETWGSMRIQYPAEVWRRRRVLSRVRRWCMEEISRVYCSLGEATSPSTIFVPARICDFGTEEQKERYLPELLTGDAVGSFAFTEPDTGSDPKRAAHDRGPRWR